MANSLRWLTVFYAGLIWLYPRRFKREFADELLSVFITLSQDAASAGFLALTVFCLRELRDFPVNLFRTHLEDNPMFKIFDSDSWRFLLRGVLAFVILITTYNLAFYLIINQINAMGAIFFPSVFPLEYYQAVIVLISWVIAAAISGTIFAVIVGEWPSLRWILTLAIVASLSWVIPYSILGINRQLSPAVFGNSYFNANHLVISPITDFDPNSVWVKVAVLLIFVMIAAILAIMLFREQPRFRWFTLAAMGVWLPGLLSSEIFGITAFLGLSKLPMEFQRVIVNFIIGGCMAGIFGILLQNRLKLVLLILAGGLLYVVADAVFYQQIYFQFLPVLFPTIDFVTMMDMTNEDFAMVSATTAAGIGLLFGLPLAAIFVWLRRGNPKTALQAPA